MDNDKIASELVKMAKTLAGGCEKLPEGAMRDNCEKKKEEGKKKKKKAAPAKSIVASRFELKDSDLGIFPATLSDDSVGVGLNFANKKFYLTQKQAKATAKKITEMLRDIGRI